jgi:acetolactate synthase-1/3 small subunit
MLRQDQDERVPAGVADLARGEPWEARAPAAGADMKIREQASERHVLTITVDNEAGILAKIAGLFTARGYNIDSLTVADITESHALSRITIVTHGPPAVIDQIRAQLERLVPVHKVTDLTETGAHVERELALVKVAGRGEARGEALRLADVFRAKVVDTTTASFIFELTGAPDKIDTFVGLMRELGLVEVGRTGIAGMMRGAEAA